MSTIVNGMPASLRARVDNSLALWEPALAVDFGGLLSVWGPDGQQVPEYQGRSRYHLPRLKRYYPECLIVSEADYWKAMEAEGSRKIWSRSDDH